MAREYLNDDGVCKCKRDIDEIIRQVDVTSDFAAARNMAMALTK